MISINFTLIWTVFRITYGVDAGAAINMPAFRVMLPVFLYDVAAHIANERAFSLIHVFLLNFLKVDGVKFVDLLKALL